jgi:YD repeat-containing protein
MNKNLITFLLTVCVLSACQHKSNYLTLIENDWKKNGLKGRVKKFIMYYDQDLNRKKVFEYNEIGFLVRVVDSYLVQGKTLVDTIVYRYDTINNITFKIPVLKGEEIIMGQEKYKYDAAGNLVEVIKTPGRTTYTYDNKNRVLEVVNYLNDLQYSNTRYEYLGSGDTRSTYFDQPSGLKKFEVIENDTMKTDKAWDQGHLKEILLYKKDKAGNDIYWERRTGDSILEDYARTYYNEHNQMVMSIYSDVKRNVFDTTVNKHTYDKFGNHTSTIGSWKREIIYW